MIDRVPEAMNESKEVVVCGMDTESDPIPEIKPDLPIQPSRKEEFYKETELTFKFEEKGLSFEKETKESTVIEKRQWEFPLWKPKTLTELLSPRFFLSSFAIYKFVWRIIVG